MCRKSLFSNCGIVELRQEPDFHTVYRNRATVTEIHDLALQSNVMMQI